MNERVNPWPVAKGFLTFDGPAPDLILDDEPLTWQALGKTLLMCNDLLREAGSPDGFAFGLDGSLALGDMPSDLTE